MELRGEYTLQAERGSVWAALNDPGILQACIPGCESVEKVSETEMKAVVAVEVGAFKARFTGSISVDAARAPTRWELRAEGRGRPAGTARGQMSVELVEADGATVATYVGQAEVGGKLGEVAMPMIEAEAAAMADDFFSRLAAELRPVVPWKDELDHTMGAVQLGDEPSEDVVEDKSERAGAVAERVEREIELAAGRDFLGGPYLWGVIALIVLVAILLLVGR